MQSQHSVSVTLVNPTPAQLAVLNDLLAGAEQNATAQEAATTKKRGKKTKPESTVSEEEEESFGTTAQTKDDLDESEESEEEESEETEESEDDGEEEEEGLTFDEVKAAINKYGEKKPDAMKAILLGFNLKSTKELQQHEKKWEPVYRKVMAKLKALKKAK